MHSLLAPEEEAISISLVLQTRKLRHTQDQVDCEWWHWVFIPSRWTRDLILTSVSIQLTSSSWDPNSFSVLLIWVSHRQPQDHLWSLVSYVHASDWFLPTLSGFWVCNPCLSPLLLPKQMPFYLENAQLPNLSLVFWRSSLCCISPGLIWDDEPYIYHHDKQERPSYGLILYP